MHQQLFQASFMNNQLGRRTLPVNAQQQMHPSQVVYQVGGARQQMTSTTMAQGRQQVAYPPQGTYTVQRHQYHQNPQFAARTNQVYTKPRQALSFIPAPVQPLQQFSFVPPPQRVVEPAAGQMESRPLSLFDKPAIGQRMNMRPLTQNYSYVPPPTRSLMEDQTPKKPEKSLDLNWLGITITEDGDIQIHGTKEAIEEMRKHPKFHDVPVRFIDINAPPPSCDVPMENSPTAGIDSLSPLTSAKTRVLFIDPEGVLCKDPTNDYGLNDEQVANLVVLVNLLGDAKCVLTCGAAHRDAGLADKYYQGLIEAGLPMDGQTEPQNVNTGLKLVGPDKVDTSTYCIMQLKANRCAEIREYVDRNQGIEFAMVQAWGGPHAYGSLPPELADDALQPHLVQCNSGLDVAGVYRYFESLA